MAYKHILIAVDLSPESKVLVEKAVSMARPYNAKVSLIHVDVNYSDLYTGLIDVNLGDMQKRISEETHHALTELSTNAGYPITETLSGSGDLGQVLVDAIKKYRELSKEGKRLVRLIINEEYSRTTVGNQLTLPCYLPGLRKLHTGFLIQNKLGNVRIMLKDLPEGTDFCFQIQMDQYLPVFRNHDILALQRRQARHNEMGLFCLNGIYYIRTLFHERGERRLRAPNVIDADILVSETDEFRCMGTILGRVNGILET